MTRLALVIAALAAMCVLAAEPDLSPPADYKKLERGLWEQTVEDERTPPPPLDPEVVTRGLDPEAKQRVLATLAKQKARGPGLTTTTHTKKFCVNDAWAAKLNLDDLARKECQAKVLSRTASKTVFRVECDAPTGHAVTELTAEVKSSKELSMATHSEGSVQGREVKSHSSYTAHFIAADCAGTK
jgi:hypothetical protein